MLQSYQLSPSNDYRASSKYAYRKLESLFDVKRVASIEATMTTVREIRQTIVSDTTLVNALEELDLLSRVEVLYKQEEEFKQLVVQGNIESVIAPVINKAAIRKDAGRTLKLLFDAIAMNHALDKDEVWMEMAEEVKLIVNA